MDAGERPVIRFRVPETEGVRFQDLVRGEVVFSTDVIGDFVIVRSDGAHVFRVGKGEVAERIAVRVGNGDSQRVEVTGTLKPGDRVVVRGGERLRQGQAVKVAAGTGAKAAAVPAVPKG